MTVLNKTSIWRRQRWKARRDASERPVSWVHLHHQVAVQPETLPSPVALTSLSRSLFSGCKITKCGHFHCYKIFLQSQPTCPGSTLKANTPSPGLVVKISVTWDRWAWACVCTHLTHMVFKSQQHKYPHLMGILLASKALPLFHIIK